MKGVKRGVKEGFTAAMALQFRHQPPHDVEQDIKSVQDHSKGHLAEIHFFQSGNPQPSQRPLYIHIVTSDPAPSHAP